jgi:hypothetical protein
MAYIGNKSKASVIAENIPASSIPASQIDDGSISPYSFNLTSQEEMFDVDSYLAVGHATSPFVTIYNQDVDTFSKVPNPANLPTFHAYSMDFSSDGVYLAVGYNAA